MKHKVKTRCLLIVAMLGVLLFGIGTAHAVLGVDDAVPGQDQVWPFICVVNSTPSNNLNTNWAISELMGGQFQADANGYLVAATCNICTVSSICFPDFVYMWTPFGVVVDNCKDLMATRNAAERTQLTVTIDAGGRTALPGGPYYAGYIKCRQMDTPAHSGPTNVRERFMNNVYLVDTPLGFASGFNGPSIELGLSEFLGEGGSISQPEIPAEITAATVNVRYFIANNQASSFNWWIFLLGRNQYSTSQRFLAGQICDESEHCSSVTIPIPFALNIFNVAAYLPGAPLKTTYPRAGFGKFEVIEHGANGLGAFTIHGTANDYTISQNRFYSLYGWSYERVQAASLIGDFDVVHSIVRKYCTFSSYANSGPPGTYSPDNQGFCLLNACLVDMKDGTIYDHCRQLSWLKNAGAGGFGTWDQAVAWAASLNAGSGFAGLTGWRLPNADPTCGRDFNCTNSEMGYLYYTEMGNVAAATWQSAGAFTSEGDPFFTNLQPNYWSGTEYAPDKTQAWGFLFSSGVQLNATKSPGGSHIWAVRPGAR